MCGFVRSNRRSRFGRIPNGHASLNLVGAFAIYIIGYHNGNSLFGCLLVFVCVSWVVFDLYLLGWTKLIRPIFHYVVAKAAVRFRRALNLLQHSIQSIARPELLNLWHVARVAALLLRQAALQIWHVAEEHGLKAMLAPRLISECR